MTVVTGMPSTRSPSEDGAYRASARPAHVPLGPDGWPADGTLFGEQAPIRSHRRPKRIPHLRPFRILLVAVLVGAMTWCAGSWAALLPLRTDSSAADRPPTFFDDLPGMPAEATDVPVPTDQGAPSGSAPPPVGENRWAPESTGADGGSPAPVNAAPDRSPATGAQTGTGSQPVAVAPPSASLAPTTQPPTAPTAPSAVAPSNGIVVRLVSVASGQSVGVRDGASSDGAPAVQRTVTGEATRWRLVRTSGGCYYLINVYSGKALDNPEGSRADGTQMQQWATESGSVGQSWCFQSLGSQRYSIRNVASGSLLDVREGPSGDGVAIQQWSADPANPNANQTWQLIRVA